MASETWRHVRGVLDRCHAPVTLFVRDDDGGWASDRLGALLDLFDAHALPMDLAVIPCALQRDLAEELRARTAGGRLGLHQHGYQHSNHEPRGRKCEFGISRPRERQRDDIVHGREILLEAFGAALDPIFTPPWNRCTETTAELLAAAGLRVLSRDRRADPLLAAGLQQLPVDVDWCKAMDGAPASVDSLDQRLAAALAQFGSVGLMLHHAVMDDAELARLAPLLALLAAHPAVQCRRMRDCPAVAQPAAAQRASA